MMTIKLPVNGELTDVKLPFWVVSVITLAIALRGDDDKMLFTSAGLMAKSLDVNEADNPGRDEVFKLGEKFAYQDTPDGLFGWAYGHRVEDEVKH